MALLLLCGQRAAAGPGLPELIAELGLSGYPAGWHPPPFEAKALEGNRISLASLRGRVVLLNFWASWCLPCLHEMPAFERLHRAYASRGLTVLGINIAEEPETARRFAEQAGVTYPVLLDRESKITADYGVIGTPSTFFVGRDGRPVAIAVGERDWGGPEAGAFIEALLAEPAE